jgi:alginate O-acetyltransferase complex protein AlgI
MIVPSWEFLGFVLIGAAIFNLARNTRANQFILLAVNILFLASFAASPVLYLPFAGFVLFGFGVLVLLQSGRRAYLATWILLTLLLFCWLKKYSVVPQAFVLHWRYVTIGLSYIFFRVMSLVIDAGQGSLKEPVGFIDYLNYTLNFTCITAGPIQRYQDYKAPPVPLSVFVVGESARHIILGLFKVQIVSGALYLLLQRATNPATITAAFDNRLEHAAAEAAVYPVYLYFNFSGYTDFVIGCALLFGLVLPENFNRPFVSCNFIEFWSRWHMSLSGWLKTYVYNPLLMFLMRRVTVAALEPFLAVFAFFVTFFLVGAWHGQTSEFLFFGLLQGGGVSVNKLYQIAMGMILGRRSYKALGANPVYAAICRGVTFTWFGFTLIWFWSNWGDMGLTANRLGVAPIILGILVVIGVATCVLQGGIWLAAAVGRLAVRNTAIIDSRYFLVACATAMTVALLAVTVILNAPAPEIVYKAF